MEHSAKYTEWEQLLNEREASGQTVKAFCSDHNITEHRYYYWRKKIADLSSAQMGFTELVNMPKQSVLMDVQMEGVRLSLYQPVNVTYVGCLLKQLRKV